MSATSLLPGQDKPALHSLREHPVLWFLVGLGCLRLDLLKFVNPRSSRLPSLSTHHASRNGQFEIGAMCFVLGPQVFFPCMFREVGALLGEPLRKFYDPTGGLVHS